MTKPIFVLNGPNLNLLGEREPHIYGSTTLTQIEERSRAHAASSGFDIEFRQSNFEGQLIEWVHDARKSACGIIINPAGYTFTSVALLDALKMFDGPKIELHISNVLAREAIYHNSLISRVATCIIAGAGPFGYVLAIDAILNFLSLSEKKES